MIRRNVAGQVIYFPQLTTTDGTPITSAATLVVAKDGVEAASAGTLSHSANGVWKYTLTQGETDAAIVGLVLTSTTVSITLNLVTTAANTAAVALGANTTTPPTATQNADAVFSASESGPSTGNQWGSTTMGRKLLRSTSTDAAVSVTGNGHVAAAVHSMQDDSISATAVSAGAVTKVAAGVWSALTSGFSVAGSAGRAIARLIGLVEDSGGDRFTAKALEEGPAGVGGSGQYAITLVASSTSGNVRGVVFSIVGTATRVETGTSGQATFNLDAGTYTLRTTPPSGWESVADSALVVAADATVAKTLVAVGYTPSNPPGCTVTIPVRSQYTTALEDVEVKLKFIGWATGATKPATVLSPPPVQTTDASGIVTVVLYRQARYVATYCVDGDQPKVVPFTVPDASTYTAVEE